MRRLRAALFGPWTFRKIFSISIPDSGDLVCRCDDFSNVYRALEILVEVDAQVSHVIGIAYLAASQGDVNWR